MVPEMSILGRFSGRRLKPARIVFDERGLSVLRGDALRWRVPLEDIASVSLRRGRRLFGLFSFGRWLVAESRGGKLYLEPTLEYKKDDLERLVARICQFIL
ncbi:hypothetical protein LQR31_17370 [Chromobacterium vaccinii]|uniref:hypothetical protein n=1 Tax=Chromobacterium vaccinii TaxID=1108595 RepID=UPI001E4BDED9|nr:hypothetical protein [Chromobacterium vaccinii]MCD4486244.1 hypothetical protein [Chromobacterium vaccinii]